MEATSDRRYGAAGPKACARDAPAAPSRGMPDPFRPAPGPPLRAVVSLALCLAGLLAACSGDDAATAGPALEGGTAPSPVVREQAPAAGEAAVESAGPTYELVVANRPDDQLYILELRLNNIVLSPGVLGYLDGSTLYLPLGQVADALEFPISVDPIGGRASGWFLSENRLFSLNMARQEVVVEGRRGSYDARAVELHADDIYVDSRLLSKWFPVDLRYDLSNSLIKARSREPLPVEARIAREEARARLAGAEARERPDYDELDVPYRWLDWPFIDFSTEGGYTHDPDTGERWVVRYNSLITADLLKMNATMFVAGDQDDGLTQARLTMGRKDPQGEILGPLRVTEFALGDIDSPNTTLVSRSNFGRGAEISSFPIGRSGSFSRIDLTGDLPLGWDIELYRNEVLIDFQLTRPDGRYEFRDVPLVYGVNVLRLEFFGPQGQRRTETRRVLVGDGQVPKGRFNFRLSANQQDTELIEVNDDPVTADSAIEGDGRFFAEAQYGVTQNFAIAAGFSSLPLLSGRRNYGSVGVRLGYRNTFSELDVVSDSEGGVAGQASVQMVLPASLSLLLQHAHFEDFVSEQADDANGLLLSRSNLRLDGVLSPPVLPRLPFSVTGFHERREGDYQETEVSNRLSMAIRMIALSNTFTWRNVHIAGTDTETANGSLLVGGRFGRAYVRGEMQYEVEPESQVTAGVLTGDWYFDTDFSARLSVQRQFVAPARTVYGAGISRKFRYASVGLSAEYGSDESATALLNVSFGIGRDPRTGSWYASADPTAEQGAVSARAFLDRNVNGTFDAGDEPIEGVRFATNRGRARQLTDEDGVAFVTNLPSYERVDVILPPRNLDDPYWVAQPQGYTLTPRPGRAAVAEFPVVTTGEIDGTVYLVRDGVRREVSEVVVELIDETGQVVQRVDSAYDGFYLFESLLPGRYTVRPDPDQLGRLDLWSTESRSVVIGGNGDVVSGIEFTLYSAE